MSETIPTVALTEPTPHLEEGFIALTVMVDAVNGVFSTVYVAADSIATILDTNPSGVGSPEEAPGAQLGLKGEESVFSVKEAPGEIFKLLGKASRPGYVSRY